MYYDRMTCSTLCSVIDLYVVESQRVHPFVTTSPRLHTSICILPLARVRYTYMKALLISYPPVALHLLVIIDTISMILLQPRITG